MTLRHFKCSSACSAVGPLEYLICRNKEVLAQRAWLPDLNQHFCLSTSGHEVSATVTSLHHASPHIAMYGFLVSRRLIQGR